MNVHIIYYGACNLGSVINMLRYLGGNPVVVNYADQLKYAERIILPGVGSFDSGMKALNSSGIITALEEKVIKSRIPFLGICLGAQLCTEGSEEGVLPGLGWIPGRTVKFQFHHDTNLKIPHMGWNNIEIVKKHKILNNLPLESKFYFVHKYYLCPKDETDVLTRTNYGEMFASALQRDNIVAMQFHPEKSHKYGMTVLKNFLSL